MIGSLANGIGSLAATPADRAYWVTYITFMAAFGYQRRPLIPSFALSVLAASMVKTAVRAGEDIRAIRDAVTNGRAGTLH